MFELTGQQKEAGDKLKHWWFNPHDRERNYFEISGPPGSGKSTMLYHIMKELDIDPKQVVYAAYTGKAALNLTLKKCPTKTIHSIIYRLEFVDKLDSRGKPMIVKGKIAKIARFRKRYELDEGLRAIVIDEGSTINEKMGKELLSFGIPLIILGDIDQLKPIYGESFFLRDPDVILTEILRQKEDDPIIQLSQTILHELPIAYGQHGPNCFVIKKEDITDAMLQTADIVICGKNKTRAEINAHIRENIYGRAPKTLVLGDKIICRQNNWGITITKDISLINGLVGFVTSIHSETYNKKEQSIEIDFRPDFTDIEFKDIKIDLNFLYGNTNKDSILNFKKTDMNLFEYGNAITCHLAQGSQYGNVLVYSERMGSDYKRWLHTAVSRAEWGLTLAL